MLATRHKVAHDHKEAIAMAINAGVDMSMVPLNLEFCDLLVELVNEGQVPVSRIDEAVRRILSLKKELGLFDRVLYDFDAYPKFASDLHHGIALNVARESMTLLKNKGKRLPLKPNQDILVVGPAANSQIMLNGAWSRSWQGNDDSWDSEGKQTLVEAIQAEAGDKGKVSFQLGAETDKVANLKAAIAAAEKAMSSSPVWAKRPAPRSRETSPSLDMPQAQIDLVKALAKTGKPIVLVLVENRPRIIREIEPLVDAVLMAYQPGEEGGRKR